VSELDFLLGRRGLRIQMIRSAQAICLILRELFLLFV
jgi:hypothetical protein